MKGCGILDKFIVQQLEKISLSMFRKAFFGIFHGSISARVEHNKFIINKREAIFDEMNEDSLIELYFNKDYRWNEASIDSEIHLNIYQNIHEAKYIAYGMPPFTMAYSLNHNKIIPKDYFGYKKFGNLKIYDPKHFEDWYERAPIDIVRYFKEQKSQVIIVRGYGVYVYDRDIHQLAKKMAIIEHSCRLLQLSRF